MLHNNICYLLVATVSGVHSVAPCVGLEHVGCGLMDVPLACQNGLEEIHNLRLSIKHGNNITALHFEQDVSVLAVMQALQPAAEALERPAVSAHPVAVVFRYMLPLLVAMSANSMPHRQTSFNRAQ